MSFVPLFLLTFFSAVKKNFNLNGIPETYFWKSQFEKFDPCDSQTPVSPVYLIYRFVYMVYFMSTLVACFTCLDKEDYFYPMYLTNQTIFLQLVYATLYFGYVFRKTYTTKLLLRHPSEDARESPENPSKTERNHLPLIAKVIWVLMSVVYTVPYVVSLVYWIFLSDDQKDFKMQCRFRRNYLTHAFNSPAALIDAIVTSVPIKFSHFVFPLLDALWYCTFSFTYEVSGAPLPENTTSLYTILYWKSPDGPGAALQTCIGAMTAGFLLFTILCWGLSRLKFMAARHFNVGPKQLSSSPPPELQMVTYETSAEYGNGIKLDTLEKRPSLDPNGHPGTQFQHTFQETI